MVPDKKIKDCAQRFKKCLFCLARGAKFSRPKINIIQQITPIAF